VLLKKINRDADMIKQWAILDSGATSHFLTTNAPATNLLSAIVHLIARLPNGAQVTSTHTCTLDTPTIPEKALAAHIIPELASHLLLSAITMCNAGCTVTLTKLGCTIVYHGRNIVCGKKCTCTGLWMIPLNGNPTITPSPTPTLTKPIITIATNVEATSSAAEYARYLHQKLCSSLTTTLLLALDRSQELQDNTGPHADIATSPSTTLHGHQQRHI
jgi:hypothetical protein